MGSSVGLSSVREGKDKTGLLSDRHIVFAFCIGVGFVLIGIAVEVWLPSIVKAVVNGWHLLLHEAPPTANALPGRGDEAQGLNWIGLAALLLKELGVAFMVAAIIGVVLEKQAKERDNERAMKLRVEVANDAVFAIYGLRHRREFVKAVVETNLEQKIVREGMHLDYRLRSLTKDEARIILPHRHDDAFQRFVILEMTSTYSFRNVSTSDQVVNVRYAVPLRQGLGARAVTGAHYVRIGEETLGELDIKAAIEPGRDDLEYAWKRTPRRYHAAGHHQRPLRQGARGLRGPGIVLPKHGWCHAVTLRAERHALRCAPPLSSANLVEQPSVPSDISKMWRPDGPLLEHNSAVFWWCTPEEDAEEVTSEQISFHTTPVTPVDDAVKG